MRVSWVLACSTVGTKEVSVHFLQVFIISIGTVNRRLAFAILTSPARPRMLGIPAIASVGSLSILVQGLEAGSMIEAMCTSALKSRGVAFVTKPSVWAILRKDEESN